ncbi:unnamed protein product, partial [Ixodes persulcatus]
KRRQFWLSAAWDERGRCLASWAWGSGGRRAGDLSGAAAPYGRRMPGIWTAALGLPPQAGDIPGALGRQCPSRPKRPLARKHSFPWTTFARLQTVGKPSHDDV